MTDTGCVANRELGLDGTYLFGSCESGRCTGQPCDVTSEEVYPCPVEDATSSWVAVDLLPVGALGLTTHEATALPTVTAIVARLLGICAAECPNTESQPAAILADCHVYADGDCAVVDYCHAECTSHYVDCMRQDGVCPSP